MGKNHKKKNHARKNSASQQNNTSSQKTKECPASSVADVSKMEQNVSSNKVCNIVENNESLKKISKEYEYSKTLEASNEILEEINETHECSNKSRKANGSSNPKNNDRSNISSKTATTPRMSRWDIDSSKSASTRDSSKSSQRSQERVYSSRDRSTSGGSRDRFQDNKMRKTSREEYLPSNWRNCRMKQPNKFKEITGDLFDAPEDYSLCHCVAEDLAMGSGIAVLFRDKFRRVDELMDQRQKTGGLAYLKDNNRYIYYLITKQRSTGKPFISDLESSLRKMRNHMQSENVTKLAMPMIGCGLDRLNWWRVSELINNIFQKDAVDIVVYKFDDNQKKDQLEDAQDSSKLKKYNIKYRPHPLVEIEPNTLLLFTASTEGEITPQIEDLNKKYYFLPEYRNRNRVMGDYFYCEKRNEWIVGLYVKKKRDDFFSFVNFVKSLSKVLKENKGIFYIGMDVIEDEHDVLIMDKLKTLFRLYFSRCELYICNFKESDN